MKYLITIAIVIFLTFEIKSQSYSVQFNDGLQTQWVHITIDTNYTSNGIYVEKEIVTSSVDTVLEQHSVLLFGNYTYTQSSANLNYNTKNYFWIPFDPSEAFYSVDNVMGTIQSGSVIIGGGTNAADPGDITYWCTCGGHTSTSENPGGCVSSYNGGKIRCVSDGPCSDGCIGSFTEGISNMPGEGGGILIQVSAGKFRLIH